MSLPSFQRLVRFIPKSNDLKVLIGEPESATIDVGIALRKGQDVPVFVWSGSSVLSPGTKTTQREVVDKVLSPVAPHEVGTIRCIGLNYVQHAKELDAPIPTVPTVFLKPSTSLASPWPTPTLLPAITQADDTGDYESELAVIIGRACKNVSETEALDYVLGYTACNDVSSRASQFAQSQWCYSKGFDGSCPIGPAIVSKELISDPAALHIRGLKNGEVMQDSPSPSNRPVAGHHAACRHGHNHGYACWRWRGPQAQGDHKA
ncbi:fumarylacetoacetate hydrolase domain-containing protein 2A [Verticillium alfalfae VaMs.102]|uniref:Fumarylacetoacetate hydrolase domain-containing protein 2A n=1 Tax=Verticillium alfalfae (strain VaMs.102 / ATCC MYA-4576 / FGSC 10136) TaxID=526221 RepID=C9S9B0_VERA1|nr:fumarylacetoacetate hydrolase domain-containing protein 2A [Verticillium alfalfae VaMs.102]EEY15973.1 fumarylacetoacetate hydrolase domain-containing protein 2A [Verticillium alfalfae VaMs.102]